MAAVPPSRPTTNWAGNFTYGARNFVAAQTLAEAQDAVRAARKLRVLGSRHSFNAVGDTEGTHLSLAGLNRVLAIDR